jgi:aminoglycoside phosphotransferase (APT) family kinase protein
MQREARVLGALAGTDVPYPGPIAASADTSVIGASFYLMEAVDGFNATVEMPPLHASDTAMRRLMGCAVVDAAAALGRVDCVGKGSADFGRLDGYLRCLVGHSYGEFAVWAG